MLIRAVRFRDHPALGTLSLDFVDPATDEPFQTVILAGENGCGKTLILNEIFSVISEPDLAKPVTSLEVELELDASTIEDIRKALQVEKINSNRALIRYKFAQVGGWNNLTISLLSANGTERLDSYVAYLQGQSRRPFRAFYSEAAVGFKVVPTEAVRATGLDAAVPGRRGGSELAQEIPQLLVDIRAADAEDALVWAETHVGATLPPEVLDRRLKRFKDAIAYMFPSKRFKTVARDNGRYNIEFEQNGISTSLDQLSTGEKQIIFRGGFVLRDLAAIHGGLLLIDEPELSLHPDWQARILGFYQRLIQPASEAKTQLIIATHSPFVVHEQATAKVIVLRRSASSGLIEVDPEPAYPTTGQARVVRALNADALIAKAEHDLILFVEGDTDRLILEHAWRNLNPGELPFFEIRPALSDSAIRMTLNDGQVFKKNPSKILVGLFDFDSAYNDWNGTWNKSSDLKIADPERCLLRKHRTESGWAMLLPVPAFQAHLASLEMANASALSIELLFDVKDHLPGMIDLTPLPSPNAFKPKMRDGLKLAFARHVAGLPATSFVAFAPIFERLRDIKNKAL